MCKSADRIRELCQKRGISIHKLEVDCGFSNASLSRPRELTEKRLAKIADYFGVSVDYLLGRDVKHYTNPDTAAIAQTVFANEDLRL